MAARQLTCYRRSEGGVGIRDPVVALPVDDLSNAAIQGIAALAPCAVALPRSYGRLQFGEDMELTFRTPIGARRTRGLFCEASGTAVFPQVGPGYLVSYTPAATLCSSLAGDAIRRSALGGYLLCQASRQVNQLQRRLANPQVIALALLIYRRRGVLNGYRRRQMCVAYGDGCKEITEER